MSVRTHQTNDGVWLVAVNRCWVPGIYDTEATARYAATLPDAVLDALGRIYRVDGENRPVTMRDLSDEGFAGESEISE